jgi:hypothetical protein
MIRGILSEERVAEPFVNKAGLGIRNGPET